MTKRMVWLAAPAKCRETVREVLCSAAGGATCIPDTQGSWVDDGKPLHEPMDLWQVILPVDHVQFVRQTCAGILARAGERAMYFVTTEVWSGGVYGLSDGQAILQ